MTTTDTETLDEEIRYAVTGLYAEYGYYEHSISADEAKEIATAVLPIIADEVRKAKAEAWEECAAKIEMQGTVQIPPQPIQGAGMTSLIDHRLDYMDDPNTYKLSPEFELYCKCGCTFTAQGSDRIEAAIAMWGEHVQEEAE